MDQALDTADIDECTKVDYTCYYAIDAIADFELAKFALHIVFDSFFFRENKLVFFTIYIEYTNTNSFAAKYIEFLQNLIFIGATNTWIVLG